MDCFQTKAKISISRPPLHEDMEKARPAVCPSLREAAGLLWGSREGSRFRRSLPHGRPGLPHGRATAQSTENDMAQLRVQELALHSSKLRNWHSSKPRTGTTLVPQELGTPQNPHKQRTLFWMAALGAGRDSPHTCPAAGLGRGQPHSETTGGLGEGHKGHPGHAGTPAQGPGHKELRLELREQPKRVSMRMTSTSKKNQRLTRNH